LAVGALARGRAARQALVVDAVFAKGTFMIDRARCAIGDLVGAATRRSSTIAVTLGRGIAIAVTFGARVAIAIAIAVAIAIARR